MVRKPAGTINGTVRSEKEALLGLWADTKVLEPLVPQFKLDLLNRCLSSTGAAFSS